MRKSPEQGWQIQIESRKRRLIAAARESLLAFTVYTFPQYEVNWHHEAICYYLDLFAQGQIKKLALFAPPQTGKSELSSRRLPAYLLGRDPDCKVALTSYAAEHAESFNRDVQRIMDEDAYVEIFPDATLSGRHVTTKTYGNYRRTSKVVEVVGHRGFLKTVGVGGPLTGTAVDVGIIDDPFKGHEDAYSETMRERVWNWYESVFESRLHNDSRQLLLLTRWHEDDLAGRILARDGSRAAGGEWEVIRFPAIKERKDLEDSPLDPRREGEAIWPERHSLERYQKIEANSPRLFISLYQQRPSAIEGNLIKRKFFFAYHLHELPEKVTLHAYMDTALSEKELSHNDETGILIFGVYNTKLYLVDFLHGHWTTPEIRRKVKWVQEKMFTHQSKFYVENTTAAKPLKFELEEHHINVNLILENVGRYGGKQERVMDVYSILESRRVGLPINEGWVDYFLGQVLLFPNGKRDEAVDCLTGALRKTLKKGRGLTLDPVRRR